MMANPNPKPPTMEDALQESLVRYVQERIRADCRLIFYGAAEKQRTALSDDVELGRTFERQALLDYYHKHYGYVPAIVAEGVSQLLRDVHTRMLK